MRWFSLVSALALGPSSLAQAAPCNDSDHLALAKTQYQGGQLRAAGETLSLALKTRTLCPETLLKAHHLKGLIESEIGTWDACVRSFEISRALDPKLALPTNATLAQRRCFQAARTAPLEMVHQPPKNVHARTPLSISVKINSALHLVHQVQVLYRRAGRKSYAQVSAGADENIGVVVPALSLPSGPKDYALEYFIRAVNQEGHVLLELGSAQEPLSVLVKKSKVITCNPTGRGWWLLPIIVVGLGAAVGAAIAVSRAKAEPEMDSVMLRF